MQSPEETAVQPEELLSSHVEPLNTITTPKGLIILKKIKNSNFAFRTAIKVQHRVRRGTVFDPDKLHKSLHQRKVSKILTIKTPKRDVASLIVLLRHMLFKIETALVFFKSIKTTSSQLKKRRLFLQKRKKIFPLHPHHSAVVMWKLVYKVMLLMQTIIYPLYGAFNVELTWLLIIFTVVNGVDVVLHFVTGYVNQNYQLVREWQDIVTHYLKGQFLIDFVLWFPLEYSWNFWMYVKYLIVIRYFLLRNALAFEAILVQKFRSDQEKFDRKRALYIPMGVVKIFNLVLDILTLSHVFACFYFKTAQGGYFQETWVTSKQLQHRSVFDQYITSYYWAFQTVTTVGYGDLPALTFVEYSVAVAWLMVGVIYYTLLMGNITDLIKSYSVENEMEQQLRQLDLLGSQIDFPDHLKMEVTNFLCYNMKKNPLWTMNSKELHSDMPYQLRRFMSVSCHYKLLYKVPFLQHEVDFVEDLSGSIKFTLVRAGHLVYRAGQESDEIYALIKGDIRIMDENRHSLLNIAERHLFGEIEVFQGKHRTNFALAMKNSILMICPARRFLRCLHKYPSALYEFEEFYKRRLAILHDAKRRVSQHQKQLRRSNARVMSKLYEFTPSGRREVAKVETLKSVAQFNIDFLGDLIQSRIKKRDILRKRFVKCVGKILRLLRFMGQDLTKSMSSQQNREVKESIDGIFGGFFPITSSQKMRRSMRPSTNISKIQLSELTQYHIEKHQLEVHLKKIIRENRTNRPQLGEFQRLLSRRGDYNPWLKRIQVKPSKWTMEVLRENENEKLIRQQHELYHRALSDQCLQMQSTVGSVCEALREIHDTTSEYLSNKFRIIQDVHRINKIIGAYRDMIETNVELEELGMIK